MDNMQTHYLIAHISVTYLLTPEQSKETAKMSLILAEIVNTN